MTALLGGHVDAFISSTATVQSHIKPGGGLRTLALAVEERWVELPDVPTFSEKGYKVVVPTWFGPAVVKGTPPAVLDSLKKTFNMVVNDSKTKADVSRLGYSVAGWSSEETKKRSKAHFDLAMEIFKRKAVK